MAIELSRTLSFTKGLVFSGQWLSRTLAIEKGFGSIRFFELSRTLAIEKGFGSIKPTFELSRTLAIWRFSFNVIERTTSIIKHISYPANLPLELISQVWIEKTDGSVESIEPLIVFVDGEAILICDAINPKLLIGLADSFDIVFTYKPKDVLPNQKYRFVIKRV